MIDFITKRPLWVNLLAALFLAASLLFIFLQLLGMITRHGEYMTVPAVTGKKSKDAIKFLEKQGFDVVITDSVYIDTLKKGIVLKQMPDANSTVKVNRTVFLTLNREVPPMVEMPALEGKTLPFALEILRRSHLQLGDTTFRPDFMKGSVLEQTFKGKRIASGEKILWGSAVDLVVGAGLANIQLKVPNLFGLTLAEAKIVLEQSGLYTGALILDPGVSDTAAAFIYRQNPPRMNEEGHPVFIQSGQWMDLWLSLDKPEAKDSIMNIP